MPDWAGNQWKRKPFNSLKKESKDAPVPLSPILGGIALAGGVGLIAVGSRKS
jgi:hypothetical protein